MSARLDPLPIPTGLASTCARVPSLVAPPSATCSGPIVVMKLGSSVLRRSADLPAAVHAIYRCVRKGERVVVVVSALGNTTDELISLAGQVAGEVPDPEGFATLLSTGETTAMALLCVALQRAGIPAVGLDADRAGLRADGPLLDAELTALDRQAILAALDERPVVVLPGFVARGPQRTICLLGRGGSDLTALFVAAQLDASRCVLCKDVDGIFDADPKCKKTTARRFAQISFGDALEHPAQVVQTKAVGFAAAHSLRFEVAPLEVGRGTTVGTPQTQLAPSPTLAAPPLRIALLGLGTVGLAVYRELAASPRFEVVGIAVRDPAKHVGDRVAAGLIATDPWEVAGRDCDVLIELIGGLDPARQIIAGALGRARHVVTANKAVIAESGEQLERIATSRGVRLEYAAAVGGAVPMLERLQALAVDNPPVGISGVLNGTCNFVLDRLAEGIHFEQAVAEAQKAGFAEADPTLDLDGSDAAQKLAILARVGMAEPLPWRSIARQGIDNTMAQRIGIAKAAGKVVRLIASCRRGPGGIIAQVAPVALSTTHPFAGVHGADNCLIAQWTSGAQLCLRGKGAGRWPTAESVLADIFRIASTRPGRANKQARQRRAG